MARRTLLFLLLAGAATAQAPWPANLFLGQGEAWRARVAVDLTNPGTEAVAGYPVGVPVGTGAGRLDLTAARAEAIRVADEQGIELLFDLRAPDGRRLDQGPIPAGATLTLPCTAAGGQRQRLYVYYDQPRAYPVPEFLSGATGALNGGFESGSGLEPEDWRLDQTDDQHRLAWVTEQPHGGAKCLRCDVLPGAAATWVAARQGPLSLIPGKRYRLRAFVRGRDVKGKAGWYIHVATPTNSMAIGTIESAGEGTYDWRPVTIEFTAPKDAVSISHGSVLYGTGTAWFDDVTLENLDSATAVTCAIGPVERLELREASAPATCPVAGAWESRVALRVANPGAAVPNALVECRIGALTTRYRRSGGLKAVRLVSPSGQVLPTLFQGDSLLFSADVPASSLSEFALFVGRDSALGTGPALAYEDLLRSPGNLARNPSFEEGGDRPTDWPGSGEGNGTGAVFQRVPGGRFGGFAAMTQVPATVPVAWVGWRQIVPVEPQASYFFAAWLKHQQVTDGSIAIHGHYLDAQGQLAGPKFWSSGGGQSGDRDWTRLGGLVVTSADTRKFELHLTMNAHGTVWYDGVLFMRSVGATLGAITDPRPSTGLQVWPENPVVKVFTDTPAQPTPARAELSVARRGQETLQLCVRPPAAGPVQVSVDAPALGTGRLGVKVERVGFVPVLQPSGYFSSTAKAWERHKVDAGGRTDGWPGWWPDYLAPVTGAVEVPAATTQPFWLTVSAPAAAAPGVYRGTVTVTAGGRSVRLPLAVTVWRFTLPERPTLQVIQDLRNGPGMPAMGGAEDRRRWERFMAERHVSPDHAVPEPVFKLVDGHVTMDTKAYDAEQAYLFDELHDSAGYWPGIFYALGWGFSPRDFLGAKYPSAEYNRLYSEAVKLFADHLKAKGWFDRMSLYISDEPHYSKPQVVKELGDVVDLIRQAAPDVPVYSSTWGHVPAWDGRLNHWGLGQYGIFPMNEWAQRHAAGDKGWFTVDGQIEIDTPYCACERLLPYYCFAHGVSGWEYWGINWLTYDPYKFGWHSFISQSSEPGKQEWVRYPNGDGYLAYPGRPLGVDGPVSTIRLEQARAGIEDYELYVALDKLAAQRPAAKAEIEAVLAKVRAFGFIPNAQGFRSTDILPNPDDLPLVRKQAGDLLDRLTG